MSGFACPHCGGEIHVFPPVREERSLWSLDVERLGRLPLDPALAGDGGRPLLVALPDSAQAHAFRGLAARVADAVRPDAPEALP
jgi:ATP-binding protein involved in chromosome partitioning